MKFVTKNCKAHSNNMVKSSLLGSLWTASRAVHVGLGLLKCPITTKDRQRLTPSTGLICKVVRFASAKLRSASPAAADSAAAAVEAVASGAAAAAAAAVVAVVSVAVTVAATATSSLVLLVA